MFFKSVMKKKFWLAGICVGVLGATLGTSNALADTCVLFPGFSTDLSAGPVQIKAGLRLRDRDIDTIRKQLYKDGTFDPKGNQLFTAEFNAVSLEKARDWSIFGVIDVQDFDPVAALSSLVTNEHYFVCTKDTSAEQDRIFKTRIAELVAAQANKLSSKDCAECKAAAAAEPVVEPDEMAIDLTKHGQERIDGVLVSDGEAPIFFEKVQNAAKNMEDKNLYFNLFKNEIWVMGEKTPVRILVKHVVGSLRTVGKSIMASPDKSYITSIYVVSANDWIKYINGGSTIEELIKTARAQQASPKNLKLFQDNLERLGADDNVRSYSARMEVSVSYYGMTFPLMRTMLVNRDGKLVPSEKDKMAPPFQLKALRPLTDEEKPEAIKSSSP
jgi:hypothetical protein